MFLWLFSATADSFAQSSASDSAECKNNVNIYFFWGEGCPHCSAEKPFLEELNQKNKEVKIYNVQDTQSLNKFLEDC